MNEQLVERNQQLERSVTRWKLVGLCLLLLLIGALAVGGTSVGMLLIRQDGGEFVWPWNRARHEEELARQRVMQAEAELVLQRQEALVELEKQFLEAAKKQ